MPAGDLGTAGDALAGGWSDQAAARVPAHRLAARAAAAGTGSSRADPGLTALAAGGAATAD